MQRLISSAPGALCVRQKESSICACFSHRFSLYISSKPAFPEAASQQEGEARVMVLAG